MNWRNLTVAETQQRLTDWYSMGSQAHVVDVLRDCRRYDRIQGVFPVPPVNQSRNKREGLYMGRSPAGQPGGMYFNTPSRHWRNGPTDRYWTKP